MKSGVMFGLCLIWLVVSGCRPNLVKVYYEGSNAQPDDSQLEAIAPVSVSCCDKPCDTEKVNRCSDQNLVKQLRDLAHQKKADILMSVECHETETPCNFECTVPPGKIRICRGIAAGRGSGLETAE